MRTPSLVNNKYAVLRTPSCLLNNIYAVLRTPSLLNNTYFNVENPILLNNTCYEEGSKTMNKHLVKFTVSFNEVIFNYL